MSAVARRVRDLASQISEEIRSIDRRKTRTATDVERKIADLVLATREAEWAATSASTGSNAIYRRMSKVSSDARRAHDFDPDLECCTPEEIANHKAACEAWDRGERDVRPHMCGNAAVNGWGIGAQTIHDEALMAALALADAISPEVVEAWELVRRLAAAKSVLRRFDSTPYVGWPHEAFEAETSWGLALHDIQALADRLAEKGESK